MLYRWCPACQTELEKKGRDYYCDGCGDAIFDYAATVVNALPVADGKVLLARRGATPHKGALDVIGDFVEYGEHPEDAVYRAVIGKDKVRCDVKRLLNVYQSTAVTDQSLIILAYLVDIHGSKLTPAEEVEGFEWVEIETLKFEKGFAYLRKVYADLKRWQASDLSIDETSRRL